MIAPDLSLGHDGELRMERLLPAPPERVWRYLTERDLLATWIADGDIEPRIGGVVALAQLRDELPINTGGVIRGIVTEWDPPRALAYTWRHPQESVESHVRFTLSAQDDATLLTLVHTRIPLNDSRLFAAGWQVHTDFMAHALAGTQAPPFMEAYAPLREHYAGLAAAAQVFAQIIDGWNRRDAIAMSAPFAERCVMIGFDGSEMLSRPAILDAMRAIWQHHQTPPYVARIRSVRMASADTAVLHAVTGLLKADGEINAATNAVTTLVAVRDSADWRVVLYQNTPAAYHGRAADAEALTQELQALAQNKPGA